MISRPHRLLLIDGLGAGLTASILGIVAWQFPALFGIPPIVLKLLFSIAVIYAAYSFSSYRFARSGHASLLKIIAVANLCYCCLTIAMVAIYFSSMTIPGIAYFAVECFIIIGLAILELRSAFLSSH